MKMLQELAIAHSKKLEELAVLHWFTQSEKISFDEILVNKGGLALEERPDFRLRIGEKIVGVEITAAQRRIIRGKFSAHEIETAQNAFAADLYEKIRPALPVIVILAFNDDTATEPKETKLALSKIAAKIDELTRSMPPRSSAMIVRDDAEVPHYPNAHVCPDLPSFLQQIQLYNDGQEFSAVVGSRGGSVEHFAEPDLNKILLKKHQALKCYRPCDEQWLVIFSGMVPPIILPNKRPATLLPSMATSFADVRIARPIRSDFDRVYFFRCPTHALNLTEAPK